MKVLDIIKIIAGHICIICSISLVVVQILDWFNPLMDFMGAFDVPFICFVHCFCIPRSM